ncbi:MAG TPA: hypothetical protein VFV33_05550 [Gemmatimonadaceae bacterium]|nr:hypothetical protein [Gemmatimonadaceae bacterium]
MSRSPLQPLTLRPSWRLFAAFALAVPAVTFCHEFGHHVVAALECGGFGRMVFTQFQERDGCQAIVGNISGPVISFLIMWLGVWLMARAGWRMVGLALVVGSIPILRVASVMSGGDDWNYTGWLLHKNRYVAPLTALVLALVVPALVLAWRRVRMPRQWLLFPATLVLPMIPAMLVLQQLDQRRYMPYVKHPEQFSGATALGVPIGVLAVYGVILALYAGWAHGVLRSADRDPSGASDAALPLPAFRGA